MKLKEVVKTKRVEKRDGTIVIYDQKKISNAILKAMRAVGEGESNQADTIAKKVGTILDIFFKSGTIPNIENIQDLIEQVLIEQGHSKIAKAYILYRKQRQNLRQSKEVFLDINKTMDGYLKQGDWRVKENSNIMYSSSGLLMHLAGAVIANYTLNNIYTPQISGAHKNGDFHIHDLFMGIMGYCAGWSIRQLVTDGFNGVHGKMASKPAKHLDSIVWQMINFIGTLQNEWAGAQAFSSFDTYLAPFIKKDKLNYDSVYQCIQAFVFNMNVPSRWGGQTPFSNITLDWVVPSDMKDKKAIIGGKEQEFNYSDCQKEMDMINKAFIEVMTAGDAEGRIFTFPIPTYNITKDFDWDSSNAKLLFEMTAKYGIPYFQNFINSNLNPSDVRSMCCRLQMDMRRLRNRGGGLFGSAELTGSIGVVTINLPRIGFISKTEDEFYQRLGELMELAKTSLEIKKKVVQQNIDNGFMPYTKRYLGTLNNHFLTIGLLGMNEAIMNFFGSDEDITTKEGKKFAEEVLDFMREKLKKFQEETGNIYNLEATPAEGTSYRLAKIDKELYPDILSQGKDDPYYTNSTQLPVDYTKDVFLALELQDSLQSKYTGGTVLHGFMGERITDWKTCRKFVQRIAINFKLPYFSLTPTFSVCSEHGYIQGEKYTCPKCNKETEVFSRVVGYYRPIKNWNKGKKAEWEDRVAFHEKSSLISKYATNGKQQEVKE